MQELKIIIWTYTVQIMTYEEDWKGKSFVRKLLIVPVWYWTALKAYFYTFLLYKWPCLFGLVPQSDKIIHTLAISLASAPSQQCTLYWTSAHVSQYLPERCCFKDQVKLKWNICSYKHRHVQCWINTQQQIIITVMNI